MILYEDEHYIAVNKPPNLLVHPYKKETNERENLMAMVRDELGHYVYVINRLDRPVSGIVLMGKSQEPVRKIKDIWNTNLVQKKYLALARSQFLEPGIFDFPLKNEQKVFKKAKTVYHPLKLYPDSTLMEVEIFTGRNHQIRRHFSRTVRHLLGDRKYGKKKYNDHYLEHYELSRIFLHSHRLSFFHPYTQERIIIDCPLAPDLCEVLKKMEPELLERFFIPDYIEPHVR